MDYLPTGAGFLPSTVRTNFIKFPCVRCDDLVSLRTNKRARWLCHVWRNRLWPRDAWKRLAGHKVIGGLLNFPFFGGLPGLVNYIHVNVVIQQCLTVNFIGLVSK